MEMDLQLLIRSEFQDGSVLTGQDSRYSLFVQKLRDTHTIHKLLRA